MLNKLFVFWCFVIFAILYIATIKGVPGNPDITLVKGYLDQPTYPLELSPERGRYLLTKSLAEFGTFDLPRSFADAAYPDVGYYNGKFYVFFAPGISVLALPFYFLGLFFGSAIVGAFSLVTVLAFFNLALLYIIGREIFYFNRFFALLSSFIFGFASSAWAYAVTLYQHHATTFFILSGFYAVWRFQHRTKYSWLWAFWVWFVLGVSIFVDYPNVVLLFPIFVYFFFSACSFEFLQSRILVRLSLVFLVTSFVFFGIMFLHGLYNATHYGGWTQVAGGLVGYKEIREQQLLLPSKQKDLQTLREEKDPVSFFDEYNFPFGLYTLTISLDRGLFFYYPIFLFSFFGFWRAFFSKGYEHLVLISIVLVHVLLYASFGDPWGGWSFGPRYMIPTMAVLSLYVVYGLSFYLRNIVYFFSFVLLFVYSSAIALVGVLTTNAVPPRVEADYLRMKYNFLLNFDYLFSGKSSSFLYNQFFADHLMLPGYYFILLLVIVYLFFSLLIGAWREYHA